MATLWRLLQPPPVPPVPERSPADVLCDPSTSPPARTQAARDAAKQGLLRLALERADCIPAGRSVGLSMLAFVFDAACASDACLDVLLRSPRDTEALAIAKAHPGLIAKALAARSCDLPLPAAEQLVHRLLGPAGAVVTGAARGLLPEVAAPALQRLLEAREPAAVQLLHALLTTPFCGDDRVAARQALAGLLLEALGIDEQGRLRIELDPAGIRFLDTRGVVRVRLEAQMVAYYDAQGTESLRVPAGESHAVRLLDAGGRLRAQVQWTPESIRLGLADGEQPLAQVITDQRGAQLQVGGQTLEALPEGAPCKPQVAKGGESARYALVTASGAFPLASATALLPPLDFDDHTSATAVEEAWESPGLRLLGPGPARAPGLR